MSIDIVSILSIRCRVKPATPQEVGYTCWEAIKEAMEKQAARLAVDRAVSLVHEVRGQPLASGHGRAAACGGFQRAGRERGGACIAGDRGSAQDEIGKAL